MSAFINTILLVILGYLPLVNGGKGVGAFCVTSLLIFSVFLYLNNRRGKNPQVKLPELGGLKILLSGLFLLAFFNLFTSIYLHASFIEWVRICSYLAFFCLILLSYGVDQEEFNRFLSRALVIIVITALIESLVIIFQAWSVIPRNGTMPNQNLAAGYILIGLTVVLSYLLFASAPKRRWQLTGLAAGAIMAVAIFLSQSRGVAFSLLAVAAVLAKLKYRKWGLIVVFLAVLAALVVVPIQSFDEVFKISTPYSYRRLSIWASSWQMLRARPWLGWGMGNFGLVFPRFNLPDYETILRFGKVTRFAHNEFLQIGAEMGFTALLLFAGAIFYVFRRSLNIFSATRINWQSAAGIAAFTGIITHSLVDFNLHLPAIMMPLLLVVALILVGGRPLKPVSVAAPLAGRAINIVFPVLIIAVLGLFTGYRFNLQAEKLAAQQVPAGRVISAYRRAIMVNPFDSYYYQKLGSFYSQGGNRDDNVYTRELAALEFRKAIQLNPEETVFYEELCYIYYQLGYSFAPIEQYYEDAIRRNPHNVALTVNLGLMYMNRKSYNEAIKLFAAAARHEPNYLSAYYYMAVCQEALGDYTHAEENLRHIIQVSDLGMEPLAQSDYERQALQVNISDSYARLGTLYSIRKKYGEAAYMLSQSLKKDPNNAGAHNALAGVFYAQGRLAPAAQEARIAASGLADLTFSRSER